MSVPPPTPAWVTTSIGRDGEFLPERPPRRRRARRPPAAERREQLQAWLHWRFLPVFLAALGGRSRHRFDAKPGAVNTTPVDLSRPGRQGARQCRRACRLVVLAAGAQRSPGLSKAGRCPTPRRTTPSGRCAAPSRSCGFLELALSIAQSPKLRTAILPSGADRNALHAHILEPSMTIIARAYGASSRGPLVW